MDKVIGDLHYIEEFIGKINNDNTKSILCNQISCHFDEIRNQISIIKNILSQDKTHKFGKSSELSELSELSEHSNSGESILNKERAICNAIFPYYWMVSQLVSEINDSKKLDVFVENMQLYSMTMIN